MLTPKRNIQTIAAAPKFEQKGTPDGAGVDRKRLDQNDVTALTSCIDWDWIKVWEVATAVGRVWKELG